MTLCQQAMINCDAPGFRQLEHTPDGISYTAITVSGWLPFKVYLAELTSALNASGPDWTISYDAATDRVQFVPDALAPNAGFRFENLRQACLALLVARPSPPPATPSAVTWAQMAWCRWSHCTWPIQCPPGGQTLKASATIVTTPQPTAAASSTLPGSAWTTPTASACLQAPQPLARSGWVHTTPPPPTRPASLVATWMRT